MGHVGLLEEAAGDYSTRETESHRYPTWRIRQLSLHRRLTFWISEHIL